MTALRGEDAIGRQKHAMTQHVPAVKTHRAKRVLGMHANGRSRMPEELEPSLAAILSADIAGYSTLHGCRRGSNSSRPQSAQAVILPLIEKHGGHIIDPAGDGILSEFPSVVIAVECAVALQKVMAERNTSIRTERLMRYRIGVNFGDVIHDEHRVYGDGVNIAPRLECIAAPGGICISGL